MRKILFVCFMFACQILLGQTISTVAGTGVIGYSGDGALANISELYRPCSVTIDKHGNIYFPDSYNNVIRKIDLSGNIATIAGTGTAGYSGDGGNATNAQLNGPTGLAIDDSGNVVIADCVNNVLRKINSAGLISTIAGSGIAGYSGDGNAATLAKLTWPFGVVVDTNGSIIFSDAVNSVVRKIDINGIITTIAGCGIEGDSGEGGPATDAKLRYIGLIAIHPKTGELYIPVPANYKVLKVAADGIITLVAGNGIAGYDGDDGPATAARFNGPNSVCFDSSGNLYIGDPYSHVVRKVNTAGIISTIGGIGTGGFNGDGSPATATQLNGPNCGAFDKWGNLYFADTYNNRIRRINYNTSAVRDVSNSPMNFCIAPNPASNEIVISAAVSLKNITVLNALGQTVFETSGSKKQMAIDIRFLPPGLYTVKVNNAYAGRFVKE